MKAHLTPPSRWRRPIAELAFLIAAGLFIGAIGPYGTDLLPSGRKYLHWLLCIVGGGLIGISVDARLGRRFHSPWRRLPAVSLAMTPPVSVLVAAANFLLLRQRLGWQSYILPWQVFLISLLVMTVRMLAWRRPAPIVETRTIVEPPLPAAEAAFRRRLSARRRAARLIAVEAHDHYLRIHTDAGSELVMLRFADALAELERAHGFRVHRSWWIAADAIEAVHWRRGAGKARLAGGLSAPVSRTHAAALKAAGWL